MGPLVDYCKDLMNLNENVEDMRSQFDKVDVMKKRLEKELKREGKKPSGEVKTLMQKVDKLRKQVTDTENKFEEAKRKWCLGSCPKFWYRIKILRQVRRRGKKTSDLNKDLKNLQRPYEGVSSLTLRRPDPVFSSMETFKNKRSQIEQFFFKEGVKNIGVWGTEELMKTTLLTLVHNSPQVREAFDDHIFWITVRDMVTVKEEIERALELNGCSVDELYSSLCEEKFLVIVDGVEDIEQLEGILKTVGLPPLGEGVYRMVFSCLSEYVVSTVEEAKAIELTRLSEEEGWVLFCRKAFGSGSVAVEMEETARIMVKDCQGLPSEIEDLGIEFRGCQDKCRFFLSTVRSWRIKLSVLSTGHSGLGKILGFLCSFLVLSAIVMYFFRTSLSGGKYGKDESFQGRCEKKSPEDQRFKGNDNNKGEETDAEDDGNKNNQGKDKDDGPRTSTPYERKCD